MTEASLDAFILRQAYRVPLLIAACCGLLPSSTFAQVLASNYSSPVERFYEHAQENKEEDQEENFGPTDGRPRKTLLQWSYGTSFGGGPDLDEPLVTDRPDFTEASSTVGRGVVQLEMGYTYEYGGPDEVVLHSYPESLLRIGIAAEWLELRVGWGIFDQTVLDGGFRRAAVGSDDLYLGIKLGLTPQEGILPEMALLPQTTVPTGADAFTGGELLPGLNLLYSWDLGERFSLAGSTQANRAAADDGEFYTELAQSVALGFSITERWGGFVEWFAVFPDDNSDSNAPEHYLDGGPTFLVTDNLQLDFRVGLGLSPAAVDYFLGSGFAIRF